jgi:release factor glutamine methyltransferase
VVEESERSAVLPAPAASAAGRSGLLAEVTALVGSEREAIWIVEHAETVADDPLGTRALALALARRRGTGEPLQYVLGTWPFRAIELQVDRRVLIPRPETERVVEVALGELARIASARSGGGEPLVCVDLGTGSGAIALSLAVEGPRGDVPLEVWATDASPEALEVARANLGRLAIRDGDAADRVTLACGTWFDALPARLSRQVDLIVSNPPYVSEEEYGDLDPTVRDWEPRTALVASRGRSGVDGTADIEAVVAGAAGWLRGSGALVVELDPAQASASVALARRARFSRVETARDLAGRVRMLVAER